MNKQKKGRAGSVRNRVKVFVQSREVMARGPVSTADVANAIGATKKDVGNALASLTASGVIARVSRGMYAATNSTPTDTATTALADTATVDDTAAAADDEYTHHEIEADAGFIVWLASHLGVDPDRVAVAMAYYDMFVDVEDDIEPGVH